MLDPIETLLQRASDRSEASEQRYIASHESLRQATDLIGMSRDAIARSREQVARLNPERPRSR